MDKLLLKQTTFLIFYFTRYVLIVANHNLWIVLKPLLVVHFLNATGSCLYASNNC